MTTLRRRERRAEAASSEAEVVNALGGAIPQDSQNVGEPSLRINLVKLSAGKKRIDCSRTPAASSKPAKVHSSYGERSAALFDGIGRRGSG